MDASYVALIHSSRVLPATRSALLDRLDACFDDYLPQVFTAEEFETLRAMTQRLLPLNPNEPELPFAAMIDYALVHSKGDGWRFSDLPPDRQAIRTGLQLLNCDALVAYSSPFASLTAERQDYLLTAVQNDGDPHWPQFAAGKWFQEVLAITTELFMSSPETYDQIGYSGIAHYPAWESSGLNTTEAWEPRAKAAK